MENNRIYGKLAVSLVLGFFIFWLVFVFGGPLGSAFNIAIIIGAASVFGFYGLLTERTLLATSFEKSRLRLSLILLVIIVLLLIICYEYISHPNNYSHDNIIFYILQYVGLVK